MARRHGGTEIAKHRDIEPETMSDEPTNTELRAEIAALKRWRDWVDAAFIELDFPYPHEFTLTPKGPGKP